ncbi:hypothetical protein DBR06_SOUSAS4510047, partial [Sousa chinensis]
LAGNLIPVGTIDLTIYSPHLIGVSTILGTINLLLQVINIMPPFTSQYQTPLL